MHATQDRPRVLILARSATASAIAAGLTERTGAECIVPAPGENADGSLQWLCAQLFPARRADEKKIIDPANTKSASLFEWTRFNLIVIEDAWLLERDGGAASLEFAGPVFASLDYYHRGNFGTRKVILVNEAALFAERLGEATTADGIELMRRRFDQKNAIEFIASDGGHGNVLERLEAALTSLSPPTSTRSVIGAPLDLDNELFEAPVFDAAKSALRSSICAHSEIILVEDELGDARLIYEAISGSDWKYRKWESGTVNVISSRTGLKGPATRYDELLSHCEDSVRSAIGHDGEKTVIVVTDILFQPPSFSETGIDLIERLRQLFGRRIGIIAFTGFRTPFITMMAYHRGADYVVEKGRTTATHPNVVTTGLSRLLLAIGFLYFERALLREKRKVCGLLAKAMGPRTEETLLEAMGHVQHLKETLPPHMVSMHLRQEWNDTYYLLRAIQNKWISEDDLPSIVKQIGATYDEFRKVG